MGWWLQIVAAALALLQLTHSMRVDPERIAARLRIEEEIREDKLEREMIKLGRNRRQLATPKEISIQVTAPLFSSRLFEFGKDAGDQEVPLSLDVGKTLQLKNKLRFYGEDFSTVYVLSNGGIGFESSSRSYKTNVLPAGAKLIAPFWNRNDLRNGGHVWYREITSGRVLERGSSEIRYQYEKTVKVKSALVVTWEKMQPLGAAPLPDDNTNTFQAAVFMTDNGTYANFIYSNVGWTQGAEAGFNKGDGHEFFALPTSGTGNIMYLEEYGNTGIPGEWMFDLGEEKIVRCKVGVKGDTCDAECAPGEWGADCARCCHCGDGVCNAVSGECLKGGCADCWMGASCHIKKENCRIRNQVQCAVNAISFTDHDRCGEPINRCQCLAGFVGDGYKHCEDINECAAPGTCHEKAVCTNTPGRYFCQCQDGFSGDGIRECVTSFMFSNQGHQPLPKTKNSKMTWQFKKPMKLFGDMQNQITISSTGLLSLSDAPVPSTKSLEELNVRGIAPFFAPIDVSRDGSVTVAEVNDIDILTRVTRMIAENFDEQKFIATNVLLVSYTNVTDGRSKKGNNFQTLLISGQNAAGEPMSFVEMLYKDLPWSQGAEAIIMSTDATNSVALPGSGTDGIELLSQLSNVNQPGVWVYRVDETSIPPCLRSSMQPPYCDAPNVNSGPTTKAIPRPPTDATEASVSKDRSQDTGEERETVEVGAPRQIQPTFVNGPPASARIPQPPPTPPRAQPPTTARTTPKPRPVFNSTPHRPLVSFSDEDIDNMPHDAFEIPFPFATIIPEIFTPGKTTVAKPLPNFEVKQTPSPATSIPKIPANPLAKGEVDFSLNDDSEHVPVKSHHPVQSENAIHSMEADNKKSFEIPPSMTEESKALEPQPEPEEDDRMETTTAEQSAPSSTQRVMSTTNSQRTMPTMASDDADETEEEEEEVEELDMNNENLNNVFVPTTKLPKKTTTIEVMKEQAPVADREETNAFVVFTTTPKTILKTTKKTLVQKPKIVTASNTQSVPDQPFQTPAEADASTSRLAIIIPSGIIATWLLLVLIIALVVCCRKRQSARQLHSLYGPSYAVRPVTSYNIKRNSSGFDGSYEDHLEKAARLSSEMNAYNQNGRVSLYGSYWNLHNSPGGSDGSNSRNSPYNAYGHPGAQPPAQPQRYSYAGRY